MFEKRAANNLLSIKMLLEATWLILIFLVPLYCNPAGYQAFYFAKSLLLIFLVSILAGLAVAQWLLERHEVKPGVFMLWLKRSPLPLAVLIFGAFYTVSTVLSIQPNTSLWGNLADKNGLISIAAWIIFFLILAQNVTSREQVNRIIITLIWSSGFMALVGILQHFIPGILPWFDYTGRVFSTAGNPLPLSAFISMCLPLTLAMVIINWPGNPRGRSQLNWPLIGLSTTIFLQAVCLWFAQYSITWILFIVGIIVFIFFCGLFIKNRFALFTGVILIVLVIILAGVLLGQLVDQKTMDTGSGTQATETTYAQQVGLPTLVLRSFTWKCAIDVVIDSPAIPFSQDKLHEIRRLIGYGPDTFIITSQLRYPASLKSLDTYRSVMLSQPENHYLFLAATVGIVGLLSFLAMLVIAIYAGFRLIRATKDRSLVILIAAVFAAIAQYCAHILFNPANILPDLVFWLALGLLAALYKLELSTRNEKQQFDGQPADSGSRQTGVSTIRKVVAAGTIVTAVIIAFGLTVGPFLADIKLHQALNTWTKDKNVALAMFTDATKGDRYEATYYGYLGYHTYQLATLNRDVEEKARLLNISLAAYDAADRLEPHLAYWHYIPADVNTYWASTGVRDKWKDALYLYENADALFPGNAVILNKWALALILFGDYEEAEVKLQQSRQNDPDWDQTYYVEGFLQAERGELPEAGSYLTKRAGTTPDSIRYFLSLCRQLALYGKLDPMRESLDSYIQANSGDWVGHALLGIVDFYNRNVEAAGSTLLKCAELAPKEQGKMLTDLVTFLSIENPQFNTYAKQIVTVLRGSSR